MQNNIVTVKPHLFDNREALKFEMVEGYTVNDFIKEAKLPVALNKHIRASINGIPCTVEEFSIPLKATDIVNIYVVPMGGDGGGKNIIRLVAMVVVTYYSAGLGTAWFGAGSFGAMATTVAFSAVGMMAVNALIPPPKLDTGGYNAIDNGAGKNTYSITGQSNVMSPYGVIPKLYGKHLFFPRLCAQPLVWNTGTNSYMTALYDFGFSEIQLSDVRLGTTSIDNFKTRTNFIPSTKGEGLRYFTQLVDIQNIGVELKSNNQIIRETALEAKTAEVEINFPRGLVKVADSGDYNNASVEFELGYRLAGSSGGFSALNIDAVGAGVVHTPADTTLTRTVDILLTKSDTYYVFEPVGGWITYYYLPSSTTIIVNSAHDLKVGDKISALSSVPSLTPSEQRTVMQDVSAGNGIRVQIDKAFTNITRTTSGRGAYTKYFSTSTVRSVSSGLKVTNNNTEAFTVTARFEFDTIGKYEISVKRITADSTSSRILDTTNWTLLRSFLDDTVLDLDTEHSIFELNLRATEQINGVVENLNALCTSKVRVYDGSSFTNEFTSNPAWVVLDILTGVANEGALDDSQIDLSNFLTFANYCDELVDVVPLVGDSFTQARHECNLVVTQLTTVADLVQSILSQARASLIISANGKYGVLYDIAKSTPVQLFTNRNSSNFSAERTYADIPHALKVKYINPSQNYETDEVIVYADGYTVANAEKFEDVETFGITDYYRAWRHGRYTLAQIIAYQETFTITVDLEHLSVQRGELVSVQADVPRIGGTPVRVKEVQDAGLTIIVNDVLATDLVSEYHYLVRADNDSIQTGVIDTVTDGTIVTLAVANPNIVAGDLFVYGFKDYVTEDYLVSAIMPSTDLKAKLRLTPYNPDVYTADTGSMPDYDSGISPELLNECRVGIEDFTLAYSITYVKRAPTPTFKLDWTVEANAPVKTYMVEWASTTINDTEFMIAGYTTNTDYEFKLDNIINNPSLVDKEVFFRITAIGTNDAPCIPSEMLSVTIVPDTTPPPQVEFFNVNVVDETLNLTWKELKEDDISYYVIKFSASLDSSVATWERSVLLTDAISYDTVRHTTNARKGTYLIKAVDTSGNMSATASRAITNIPEIVKLNFVQDLQDSVTWLGEKLNFELEDSEMVTTPVTSEPTCPYTMCDGWWSDDKDWSDTIIWTDIPFDYAGTDYAQNAKYTFLDMVDLGDVYTARINVDINAYATRAEEIMYSWVKLSDIDSLATTRYDLWNCYIVARTATVLSGISTWAKMSDVVAMSDGLAGDWTDEVLTEMGDLTGRYFRFYLVAESITEKIRINVTDAIINIDMPDRITSENDIISSIGGSRIDFSTGFYAVPALGITQDGAVGGDYYTITLKDKTGFNIEFFDVTTTSVVRQFDYMAKAYGALV